MIVRKLRLQRGWSQEHLASLTGLNIRTIQRIERGQNPSLDSQKALAAVFEVDISTFNSGEDAMIESGKTSNHVQLKDDERQALEYAKGIIGLYSHVLVFVIFLLLSGFYLGFTDRLFLIIFGGWGIGIIFHALNAYEVIRIFSARVERKIVEKYLGRKL